MSSIDIEFYELAENFGVGINNEDATLELKLEYSLISDIEFRLFKEKCTNDLILVIIQPNGDNFIFKSSNLSKLRMVVNKIILNLEYCKVMQSNTNINLRNSSNRKSIRLLNKTERTGKHADDSISGTLIESVKELEIGGENLRELETIIPSLLAMITTSEGAIDFSLMDYSLITKGELFKSLLEEGEGYSEEEIASINQYKRGDGPGLYFSNVLRENKIYYHENFYVEEIKKFEKLFGKAPRLKRDIILYRGGSGNNRTNEIGQINLYDGLVSFSTEKSVGEHFATKYHGYTIYRMKLPKGTPCLGLFSLDGLEGRYINEFEVLMPSFLYHVIRQDYNKENGLTEYDISYLGKISMIELLYERLKRARQIPKLKYRNTSKEIICNSQDNLLNYAQNGFNPNAIRAYNQLDLIDAIKFLYARNLIAEIPIELNNILLEELNNISEVYGFQHVERVYFMSLLLAELDGLNKEDRRLLTTAVKYHNIGRESDFDDEEIGKKSADKLRTNIDRLKEFSKEEQDLILFVIEQHSKSTSENEEALLNLPQDKCERYRKILYYLKDADMLDSPRLGTNIMIDINSLHLETSKRLILLSYELNCYYEDIFNYIREIDIQTSRLFNMNNMIELIENTEYEGTPSQLMEITKRILDGESINVRTEQILGESILEALKCIRLIEAINYFKELVKKVPNIFRRGKKNGK